MHPRQSRPLCYKKTTRPRTCMKSLTRLTRTQRRSSPKIVLLVGCFPNGMLSDSTIGSYVPYSINRSQSPRLFSWKPSLLPYEKETSWVWRKRCAVAFSHFLQTLTSAQGSGKTLAYGLPILHKLLSRRKHLISKIRRPVRALILAPTRELALQISSHLSACLNDDHAPTQRAASTRQKVPNPPPLVSVAAIVGGISPHKQKRILSRGVDVLVATPGRLWDIVQEVCITKRSASVF